ncbi:unnamed protein product [Adineta steineri]|uniref:Uncharacterized protein n=1 Tax=Adineta steineri TaxID=433720 RepID=A0A815CD44_9BILA|nr:unnamed protein product [Adineta steineri]CAF1566625.1 unnamed protein product [Adineta steineri]
MDWLNDEISSLNYQIKSIKNQVILLSHTRRKPSTVFQQEPTNPINTTSSSRKNKTQTTISSSSSPSSSSTSRLVIRTPKNQRNIYIIKLLSTEPIFDGYREDLIDIYEIILTTTIECIAVVIEKNSTVKNLFLKLSNGTIDSYYMNRTISLKETYWKLTESIVNWNNANKQLEYYRRFIPDNKTNEIMINDQLTAIQNRPKIDAFHFFDMMGPVLRIKYHVDSSSLSCILEQFFDDIYTCDGRLIYPHELQLLSGENNLFVFYAVMMDTTIDKQIYPLETNNRIRQGDQIFYLFNNHPQFSSLSALSCPGCVHPDQPYLFNNPEQAEQQQQVDSGVIESSPIIQIQQNLLIINIQNFIVYAIATSLGLYVLFAIFLNHTQKSTTCLTKKQSVSSRRGR